METHLFAAVLGKAEFDIFILTTIMKPIRDILPASK